MVPDPWLDDGDVRLYHGDVLDVLASLPAGSVQMCVTSPPYWGLRDYGSPGQIGLESTPEAYVRRLVTIFGELKRVLRDDGTLWLNLGDSYNAYNGGAGPSSALSQTASEQRPQLETGYGLRFKGLKPKDLVGIPWRVAFALQADGWYLRSDIIWSKPNPMPESVSDRPTKSHEHLFLLSKQPRYFYDADAISEDANPAYASRYDSDFGGSKAEDFRKQSVNGIDMRTRPVGSREYTGKRNARSVWEIATKPTPEAHFATYPEALVRRCILAGTSSVGECAACHRPVPPLEYGHETSTTATVRTVRDGVPEASPQGQSLLLPEVRLDAYGSEPSIDQGLHHRPEGLQVAATAASSNGEPRGLRDRASLSDGGAPWPDADGGRGRSSSEWGQDGQPGRKSGSDAEAHPRPEAKAADQADRVSALRRDDHGEWSCPACGCREVVPQLCLDPFIGSGTTALVARKHGRRAVGIDLNEEYLGIAARRTQQLPLLAIEEA